MSHQRYEFNLMMTAWEKPFRPVLPVKLQGRVPWQFINQHISLTFSLAAAVFGVKNRNPVPLWLILLFSATSTALTQFLIGQANDSAFQPGSLWIPFSSPPVKSTLIPPEFIRLSNLPNQIKEPGLVNCTRSLVTTPGR